MRTLNALVFGALAMAASIALVTPTPTLAALNDVVSIEVGVSAWTPTPSVTSTTGQPSETAPAAGDPFSPLTVPAPAEPPADEVAPPTASPETPEQDGTEPGAPEATAPAVEPTVEPDPEPAVAPEVGTTVSPAEETPSATGTEGAVAGDGVAPTSPDPTLDR